MLVTIAKEKIISGYDYPLFTELRFKKIFDYAKFLHFTTQISKQLKSE